MKQASVDHCGINTSALRSLITTPHTIQVLAVNRAECFTAAFLTKYLISKWVFVHRKFPHQIQKLHKASSSKQKRLSKTSEEMLCKLISNTKRDMIKKLKAPNLNNPIMLTSYSRKQTTRQVKFPSQIFGGSGHISLRKTYPTINMWYAKLVSTRRKSCRE